MSDRKQGSARMTAPDFAAILDGASREFMRDATVPLGPRSFYALAAKVPDLCPDCDGQGTALIDAVDEVGPNGVGHYIAADCDHSNAPTIGDLLALADTLTRVAADCGVDSEVLIQYGRLHANIFYRKNLRTVDGDL